MYRLQNPTEQLLMPNNTSSFLETLGYWFPTKILEIIVFLIAFLLAGETLENVHSGGLFYSSKIALAIIFFYGVVWLYLPLSLGITAWLRPDYKWFGAVEFIFYLTHSIVAISIAYNGIFGLSDRIAYLSPLGAGMGDSYGS